jgi:hypothetical protein
VGHQRHVRLRQHVRGVEVDDVEKVAGLDGNCDRGHTTISLAAILLVGNVATSNRQV